MLTKEQLDHMDTFPFKPRVCVWELTLACNLRCGHCGSRAGIPRDQELETSECLALVEDLAAMGCEVITLSGGEPTMHPGWLEIARAIRDAGMIPNMVTNGIHLDDARAREMKEAGLSNVAISIDGPAEVHEAIRGPNTFGRTCEAVAAAQRAGLPVTIMTTINQLNLPHLESIHALCTEMKVNRWRLQLGKPMGNLEDHEDWVIEPKEILYVLPRLHRLAEQGPVQVGIGDSLGFHSAYDIPLRATSWKGTPQKWSGCQAGMLGIGIESDGGIKGCLSMQDGDDGPSTFREGTIRERSLFDIWTDPQAFAYNRRFSLADLTGSCAACQHARSCRGGAHCVSIAVNGTTSENPYCYYMLAEKARQRPVSRIKNRIATAAALMFAGSTAGCLPPIFQPDYGADPCENVDCSDPNLPQGEWEMCCAQPEYGVDPTCDDYACNDPDMPAWLREECCYNMDYGVDPPTCDDYTCDDPDMPGWLHEECCLNLDYGVDPPVCDEVDCDDPDLSQDLREECCLNLEYGVDPCANVCCDCDYGDPPPEGCCP